MYEGIFGLGPEQRERSETFCVSTVREFITGTRVNKRFQYPTRTFAAIQMLCCTKYRELQKTFKTAVIPGSYNKSTENSGFQFARNNRDKITL